MCKHFPVTLDTTQFVRGLQIAKEQLDALREAVREMPQSPMIACPCGSRRQSGEPCPRCGAGKRKTQREYDRRRGSATERGYDYQWQLAREAFLKEHPLCRTCETSGEVAAATVVDHIMPHRGNSDLFWDIANWQPLCERHHNEKTGRGQ